jgi:hypothetical protein
MKLSVGDDKREEEVCNEKKKEWKSERRRERGGKLMIGSELSIMLWRLYMNHTFM